MLNMKIAAGKTVLLAEDDPFNALLIKTQCKRHGIGLVITANGQKAYDMAMDNHFDLILTDINMPVLSGIDLVKKIRSTPHLATMPIIALTASKTVDDTKNMHEAGVSSILYKPFTESELIGKLMQFLH
jgi:CheY-like chemotaxis protein